VPGVIIFDLMMPGMSGQHLRAELVQLEGICNVPRLIFTAAGERHIQQARVEPDVVIRKPLSIPILLGHLEKLIGRPST
jgi:CheY-like chemotaxis protein